MSRVVNISEAASIAIHAMVLIGKNPGINGTQIAEKANISRNHLAKVMQRLSKDNLVKSVRGPLGGFYLARDAKEITMLEIYESIEGKITNSGCPLEHQICPFDKCIMGNIVFNMTDSFIQYMKNNTLAQFLSEK